MSELSEEIFKNIENSVDIALLKICTDISKRYNIDFEDIETKFMDKKQKKKNVYNKFNKKRRKELQEEGMTDFGKMSQIIGKEWGNLSEKDKEKYK
jgi:hypothetical protein